MGFNSGFKGLSTESTLDVSKSFEDKFNGIETDHVCTLLYISQKRKYAVIVYT